MSKIKKFDAYAFTIQTERVVMEGVQYFKASLFELPSVEVYEKSAALAYKVIIESIEDLHEAAIEDGQSFPSPEKREQTDYSGRVTLRISKDLHRRIDLQAKRNGNTLNTEIVCQLSQTSSIQETIRQMSADLHETVAAAIAKNQEVPLTKASERRFSSLIAAQGTAYISASNVSKFRSEIPQSPIDEAMNKYLCSASTFSEPFRTLEAYK